MKSKDRKGEGKYPYRTLIRLTKEQQQMFEALQGHYGLTKIETIRFLIEDEYKYILWKDDESTKKA